MRATRKRSPRPAHVKAKISAAMRARTLSEAHKIGISYGQTYIPHISGRILP